MLFKLFLAIVSVFVIVWRVHTCNATKECEQAGKWYFKGNCIGADHEG